MTPGKTPRDEEDDEEAPGKMTPEKRVSGAGNGKDDAGDGGRWHQTAPEAMGSAGVEG